MPDPNKNPHALSIEEALRYVTLKNAQGKVINPHDVKVDQAYLDAVLNPPEVTTGSNLPPEYQAGGAKSFGPDGKLRGGTNVNDVFGEKPQP